MRKGVPRTRIRLQIMRNERASVARIMRMSFALCVWSTFVPAIRPVRHPAITCRQAPHRHGRNERMPLGCGMPCYTAHRRGQSPAAAQRSAAHADAVADGPQGGAEQGGRKRGY
jgi:hypothetical protein